MDTVVSECGLTQADLDKFVEGKIDGDTLPLLSVDDLRNLGFEIGPARQIYTIVNP